MATMAVTAMVNLAVVQYVGRIARQTDSPAISSDARHLWTNVVQAVAIFSGLALVAITGDVVFDALFALGLAGFLFWTSGHILWDSTHDILDASLKEEDVRFIEQAILKHREEIAGFHRLRTRRSGQRPYIDVHVIQPPGMTVGDAAAVVDRIEAGSGSAGRGHVTIQTEPADGASSARQSPDSRGLEGEPALAPERSAL
jgi:cation diffusion facilitator family transporter